MRLWRIDYGTPRPVEVEAPDPWTAGRDHDSEGKTIYSNSHYSDLDLAWAALWCEVEAGLSLSASAFSEAEKQRERALEEVGKAITIWHKTRAALRRGALP